LIGTGVVVLLAAVAVIVPLPDSHPAPVPGLAFWELNTGRRLAYLKLPGAPKTQFHRNETRRGPRLWLLLTGGLLSSKLSAHPEGHRGGGDFWDLRYWVPTFNGFEKAEIEFSWPGVGVRAAVILSLTGEQVRQKQSAVRIVWK